VSMGAWRHVVFRQASVSTRLLSAQIAQLPVHRGQAHLCCSGLGACFGVQVAQKQAGSIGSMLESCQRFQARLD